MTSCSHRALKCPAFLAYIKILHWDLSIFVSFLSGMWRTLAPSSCIFLLSTLFSSWRNLMCTYISPQTYLVLYFESTYFKFYPYMWFSRSFDTLQGTFSVIDLVVSSGALLEIFLYILMLKWYQEFKEMA